MNDPTLQRDTQSPAQHAGRISVVVPSYNHAPFIAMTLRSIFRQTALPAELLVIDDGSIDGSPRIIEQSLKHAPMPAELIARNNRGLCATLNEALDRTDGEYFAYLGSDDVWLAEFLEQRVRLLNDRADAALAYGHAYLIDEDNRIVDSTREWADYADADVREMLLKTIAPMSSTVVYRRAALESERWNEEARLEDYDLYLRLAAARPFAFDPRELSAWRRHPANTSLDQSFMLAEQLRALREAASRFGLSEHDIKRLQREATLHRAEDFLRLGQKRQALALIAANPGGVGSPASVVRMTLRLLAPFRIVKARKAAQRRRYFERHGSIDI